MSAVSSHALSYHLLNKVKSIPLPLIFAALSFIAISCADNTPDFTAKFKVRICDGPSTDFKSFILDIQAVQVKITSDSKMAGWNTLDNVNVGQYDLLSLSNGKDSLIASEDLPVGGISQVKLVLGTNNKVVLKDGTEKPLYLLASQLGALKLNINAELYAEQNYEVFLDIDVSRSVRVDNSGAYFLFPSIRAFKKDTTGGVSCNITPKNVSTTASLISETDTIGGAISQNGYFYIRGISAGSNYRLVISPISDENYSKTEISNINVLKNTITSFNLNLKKKND